MILTDKLELIERPGFLGRKRKENQEKWDLKYKPGKWQLVWKWGDFIIDFEEACKIYEDAYFMDSINREDIWKELFKRAKDFYDNAESNVNSRTDYTKQEAYSHHIQDIAARRVGIRRGWKMQGNRLIQIRGPETEGHQLMPGIVEFHFPKMIETPRIHPNWANPNSVESFYQ